MAARPCDSLARCSPWSRRSGSRGAVARVCGHGDEAGAGAAVRLAVGGVCGQHLRHRGSAFDAFPLIAILVLHAGPTEVSVLAAAGLAAGAVVAVPLGPWVEFRRKRPVMVAMDLVRFAAVMSIPAAYALGWLSSPSSLVVSVIVAAANIAFKAASGAYLKALVRPEDLLVANARLRVHDLDRHDARTAARRSRDRAVRTGRRPSWPMRSATCCRPWGIRAIGGRRAGRPHPTDAPRLRAADLLEGWRTSSPTPRCAPLFFNTLLVNGLIMATAAAARRPHARPPRVPALAVRPRVRSALRSAASSAHGWPTDSWRGSGSTR